MNPPLGTRIRRAARLRVAFVSTASSYSRRDLLRAVAAVAAAIGVDPARAVRHAVAAQTDVPCAGGDALGELVGTLPLSRPDGIVQPLGIKLGGPGLDARLFTDLSRLEPNRLITPTELAYVRTECPPAVAAHTGPWQIRTSGLVAREGTITLPALTHRARPMGAHLFECSGNSNPANFGLMSVAEWTGVPLAEVVSGLRPSAAARGVLVSGVDPEARSVTSIPGASWVFPLDSLARLGAFLALGMNGGRLPPDHGDPVRLVVPGWYGCAWIKWVDQIRLVGSREPATVQMREFAERTHQTAVHALADDYAPPAIDTAAMPVRVEKRRGASGLEYGVVGIVWGGSHLVDRLSIRFSPSGPWSPFPLCPAPRNPAVWSVWTYRWKPAAAGVYDIALRVPDPSVPQRRLAMGYYARQVRVDEV